MHPRALTFLLLALSAVACSRTPEQRTVVMDPNDISFAPYQHGDLPPEMLTRIRATTDTFQSIDGITYEKAVDLYKRDLNPEENLALWEEMVRAYKSFCRTRCNNPEERMDVYRTLLLRSMFSEEEALARSQLKILSQHEAKEVMQL